MFARPLVSELVKRMRETPRSIIYVSGPRQTGKTTASRQALAKVGIPHRYCSADAGEPVAYFGMPPSLDAEIAPSSVSDGSWIIQNWNRSRVDARRSERGFVLVLDEIQNVPDWSLTVKGLWDADRFENLPLRVVILGSAHLRLQSSLRESLAGRFEPLHFTHWSLAEMSEAFGFDTESYVYFGGSPGAAKLIHDEERWRRYVLSSLVEAAIERDILAMTRIRKPALFKQLLELGCELSGQTVSFNKLLGRMQDAGNTTTLARYIDLLSTAGLLSGIEKYSGSRISIKASSPKLNVYNTAYLSAFSDYSFAGAKADRVFWGRLVESAVGAHLLNSTTGNSRVYYWRDGNSEVDFVLRSGRRLVAIEVKSGDRLRSTRGMKDFANRYSPLKCVVVGADGIPLSDFLSVPTKHWFGDT